MPTPLAVDWPRPKLDPIGPLPLFEVPGLGRVWLAFDALALSGLDGAALAPVAEPAATLTWPRLSLSGRCRLEAHPAPPPASLLALGATTAGGSSGAATAGGSSDADLDVARGCRAQLLTSNAGRILVAAHVQHTWALNQVLRDPQGSFALAWRTTKTNEKFTRDFMNQTRDAASDHLVATASPASAAPATAERKVGDHDYDEHAMLMWFRLHRDVEDRAQDAATSGDSQGKAAFEALSAHVAAFHAAALSHGGPSTVGAVIDRVSGFQGDPLAPPSTPPPPETPAMARARARFASEPLPAAPPAPAAAPAETTPFTLVWPAAAAIASRSGPEVASLDLRLPAACVELGGATTPLASAARDRLRGAAWFGAILAERVAIALDAPAVHAAVSRALAAQELT